VKSNGNRALQLQEIADRAARLIADHGLDAAHARQKAASQVLGEAARAALLPDPDQIETALRAYLRASQGEAHRQRLWRLRQAALHWMQVLEPFRPCLVGPVLNACATQDCAVHLHLYADSAKDVEMALLDRGLDIRVGPPAGTGGRAQECIGLVVPGAGPGAEPTALLLTVFDAPARRNGGGVHTADPLLLPLERSSRADVDQLRELLAQTGPVTAHG